MNEINLSGELARLIPINEGWHLDYLWHLMNTDDLIWLGRFDGETSDREKFMEQGRRGVHCDFIIADVDGSCAGYVYSYGYLPKDGVIYWGVVVDPRVRGEAWFLEGVALFFDYLFANWNLALVIAETYEYQLDQFHNTAGRWLREDGRIPGFKWWNGRRWAKCFYSLTPEAWAQQRTRVTKVAHWLSNRMEQR